MRSGDTTTLAIGAMVLLLSLGGCSGAGDHGTGPPDGSANVFVSDTSGSTGALLLARAGGTARALAGEDGVVYVSVPSGVVPNGELAIIRNRRTDSTTTAIVADGGFDPRPIAGAAGDIIDIDVRVPGGTLVHLEAGVPLQRPPRVVRVQPPRGRTDVPLNARLAVTFTEPIDEQTLASSIQLLRGTEAVAGSWHVTKGATEAVFEPDAQLAPNTAYQLDITRGVRDLDGAQVDEAVSLEFTTGSHVEIVPTSEVLDVESITMLGGGAAVVDSVQYFALVMKNTTTSSDSGTNYPLFDQTAIRRGDAGDTLVADAVADPDFAGFAALVTDGIDEMISVQVSFGGGSGGSVQPESRFFIGRPGAPPDFAGYTIDRVAFVIDSVRFATPGSNGNGTGIWTDHDLAGRLLMIGHRNASRMSSRGTAQTAWRSPRRR